MKRKNFLAVLILAGASTVFGQTHTVLSDFGPVRVNGANSSFSIDLTVNPADVDISGFSIVVCYDNTQMTLVNVTDNTGQPFAAVEYTQGDEQVVTGVPNVNVGVPVVMSTLHNLATPSKIARLNFVSSSTYSDPTNRVWLHLENNMGNLGGLSDGNLQNIPTSYHSPESDPQLVPVSLSAFTVE